MFLRHLLRIVVLVLAASALGSPATEAQRAPKQSAHKAGKIERADPGRSGLTDADRERATAFGRQVEREMAEGEVGALEAALDYTALAKSALAGLELPEDEAGEYAAGLVQGMKQRGGLGSQLAHLSVRFLRVKEVDGTPKLIFGMVSPEGALNYYLFDFEVRSGDVRLVDFYPLATGEPLSATLRRLLIPAIAQRNKGFLARLFDRDDTRSILESYATFGQMGVAAQQGDYETVASGYESLDPALREDKLAMVMAISAYSMLGDDARLTSLSKAYETRFPGDASLPLMMADARVVAGLWKEALDGLDEVEALVGEDPYLETTRAGIYLQKGDLDEALKRARVGADALPGIELTHWQVATVAATASDHPTVAAAFRNLRGFGYYFLPETVTDPAYAEFLASAPAATLFEEERQRMADEGIGLEDLIGN